MSVVVDTSIWVDHFRHPNVQLVELLMRRKVLTHHVVLGEIACGTPPAPRERSLALIGTLPACVQAKPSTVLELIERERLYGRGCGFADLTLLASTLSTPGARLWTRDRPLKCLASHLGVLMHETH